MLEFVQRGFCCCNSGLTADGSRDHLSVWSICSALALESDISIISLWFCFADCLPIFEQWSLKLTVVGGWIVKKKWWSRNRWSQILLPEISILCYWLLRELENCQGLLHDRPVASADSLGRWNMQEWVERIRSKMKNDYKLIFSLLIILNSLLVILLCSDNVPLGLSNDYKLRATMILRNLEVIEKQIISLLLSLLQGSEF